MTVLLPAPLTRMDSGQITIPDNGMQWTQLARHVLTRTGQWQIFLRGNADVFASSAEMQFRILINGAVGDSSGGGSGFHCRIGLDYWSVLAAGTTVDFQGGGHSDGFSFACWGQLICQFVPTPTQRA